MALSRAAGACRLALRTQWAMVRQLGSASSGSDPPGHDKKRGRLVDLGALRRERELRPPAERRQLAPTRKATHEQMQLNRDIQACASAEAVLGLVSSRLAVFNEVNAATALITISRRMKKDEAARWLSGDARFAQLLSAAESLFARMVPQELSNTLYACGQLDITPPADWLQRYWLASASKLGEFVPQALSNTMYASAQLCVTPPSDWMERFWHASALKLDEFNEQDFSNTLYACGQLGVTPPADWLRGYWHVSALKLGWFNEQAWSNTLYACVQLGITPPADWLQRYWHVSTSKLRKFKPQDFSNTIYAYGQLGITPPAGWLQRYWHASASELGVFTPQGLSNTLYACGQLGITPPADWLQRFLQASASKLGEYTTQNLSNTLYAFAQIDVKPPAGWLQAFSDSFEQSLPDTNLQDLSNTAFALATLGLWELPLWRSLWERLCLAMPRDAAGWNAEAHLHARQLYLAYQMAAVERPGLLPAPDPELLAAARKSWFDAIVEGSSRLHEQVSACLARMGLAHTNERWCERAERLIDIAIEGAGAPVALEVDGPTHFLQDGRQDGRSQLRNRMLAAHGWRVVVVDYREWNALQTQSQREEYLRRLLA